MGYHIKYDKDKKEILAGTMNKKCDRFINSSEVTTEALEAVRDHFVSMSLERKENVVYAWQYDNGKAIVMKFEVIDSSSLKKEEDKQEEGK